MDRLPKNLKTGDIMLFSDSINLLNPISWFGKLIEIFTGKPYSHVGMILKDPTWIKEDMKGLYLWESSFEGTRDPQDEHIKLGVMITPMERVLEMRKTKIYVKQLSDDAATRLTVPIMEKIHKIVYDKPYDFDPIDWLAAYLRKGFVKRTEHRYFCSALVACIYTEAGILDENTNWTLVRPSDFDENPPKHLKWVSDYNLQGLIEIL